MSPRYVSAIRAELWSQMWPQRMAPDAAMMVLKAKVPTKLGVAPLEGMVFHLVGSLSLPKVVLGPCALPDPLSGHCHLP